MTIILLIIIIILKLLYNNFYETKIIEMKSLKIETSPSTHGVYFQAISKAINQRGMT